MNQDQDADALVRRQALFSGLVFSECGEPAQTVFVGDTAHYVVSDQGFMRHVEAFVVDRAVIGLIQEQIASMQDEIVLSMLQMLGSDDLFTKAAIDASLRNLEQSIRRGDPEQWIPWLQMLGFRVTVDVHGQVVDVVFPHGSEEDE